MPIAKIDVKTIRKHAFEKLRQMIIQAEFLPGEIISLRRLAGEFGVSLIPIREALWQLEAEKLVVINNKQFQINKLSKNEMLEALRLRIMLESDAAKRACKNRPDSSIMDLKSLLDHLRDAHNNSKEWTRQNSKFHFYIYSFANSKILFDLIEMLRARVGPYFSIHALHESTESHWKRSFEIHSQIYEGFANKNEKMLLKALRQDLEESTNYILPFLDGN